jgi:hypothetical protein
MDETAVAPYLPSANPAESLDDTTVITVVQ